MNDYEIIGTDRLGNKKYFMVRATDEKEARALLDPFLTEPLEWYSIRIEHLGCIDPCLDNHIHIKRTNCECCTLFQVCKESRCLVCWKI